MTGGVAGGVKTGGQPSMAEGYLNLADVVGINSERDRSTYYYGPRAG
jgi:hypothetical protein